MARIFFKKSGALPQTRPEEKLDYTPIPPTLF